MERPQSLINLAYLGGFYPEIGGPFSAAKALLSKLSAEGVGVIAVSSLPVGYDQRKIEFVRTLPYKVEYLREGALKRIFPSYSASWGAKLAELQDKVDVFHVNGIFDYFAILAPFILKKPYVLSVRGSLMTDAFQMNFFKRIKKTAYMRLWGNRVVQKAAVIHVMCEMERENFSLFFPDFRGPVKVIPNGLNMEEFLSVAPSDSFRKRFPALASKKYVLSLGRLHPIKGLDILIRAFRDVSRENDWTLVLAGPDTNGYSETLKRLALEFGIADRVFFTGMLTGEDKVSVIKSAEVFVMPSYSENFGVSAVEAMACGTPTIVSDRVGISREIARAKAGVVVELTAEAVAAGILSLARDQGLRELISSNGVAMAKEHYDINSVSRALYRVYCEVAEGRQ